MIAWKTGKSNTNLPEKSLKSLENALYIPGKNIIIRLPYFVYTIALNQKPEAIQMNEIIPSETIMQKIYIIRGKKVMIDMDLAALYKVETKQLKRQVHRNIDRFPDDFMFVLSDYEFNTLRRQSGTSRWGGTRYAPMAFTEQGVAMLSSVLNSPRAIQVNIQIIRAFVHLRRMISSSDDLRKKIEDMEKRYDKQFKIVFDALRELLREESNPKKKIGF